MISLERSPAYTNHNIPLKSEHFYRGVIVESYDDLWETDLTGREFMRGYGKGGTDSLSFQQAYPNALYVNGLVKANMIIEGDNSLPIIRREARSGYTYVGEIERRRVESGEMSLRVYQRYPVEGRAMQDVHEWELVFDSFKKGR